MQYRSHTQQVSSHTTLTNAALELNSLLYTLCAHTSVLYVTYTRIETRNVTCYTLRVSILECVYTCVCMLYVTYITSLYITSLYSRLVMLYVTYTRDHWVSRNRILLAHTPHFNYCCTRAKLFAIYVVLYATYTRGNWGSRNRIETRLIRTCARKCTKL